MLMPSPVIACSLRTSVAPTMPSALRSMPVFGEGFSGMFGTGMPRMEISTPPSVTVGGVGPGPPGVRLPLSKLF